MDCRMDVTLKSQDWEVPERFPRLTQAHSSAFIDMANRFYSCRYPDPVWSKCSLERFCGCAFYDEGETRWEIHTHVSSDINQEVAESVRQCIRDAFITLSMDACDRDEDEYIQPESQVLKG